MSTQVTLPKASIAAITRMMLADSETRFQELVNKLAENKIEFDAAELRSLVVPDKDSYGDMFKAGKISGKRRKDPNAPKKAPSAYMLWLNKNREDIKNSFEEELVGKEKVTKVAKKAGQMWGEMSDEDKAPYVEKAEEAAKAYKEAKANYVPADGSVSTSGKIDFLSLPVDQAPEGWSGPFDGKFLWKFAAKRKFGIGKFKTFKEAVAAAEQLIEDGEECSGITRDKTGYTLRQSKTLCEGKAEDGNISWVIGAATVIEPNEMKSKKSQKTQKVKFESESNEKKKQVFKKPSKAKTVSKTKSEAKPDAKSESKPESKPKAKPESKPKKKTESKPKPSDGDSEEISVEEKEIDGTLYLYEEASGDVYDSTTHQIIGKYVDGELELN